MDARAVETLPDRTVREDPLTWSGTRIARAIREGEKTSEEIVALHVAHAQRVHPRINAVVRMRADRAIEEARHADATRRESRAPFHGVPCTIKEAFALEGMPNSAGLVSR